MMTLEQAMQRIQSLEEELAQAQLQMAWFKKKLFGGGQGETIDKAQMTFALDLLQNASRRSPCNRSATSG